MHQSNNSSLIFPVIHPLPEVLGNPRLRADVLFQIQSDPSTNAIFQSLAKPEQEAFLGFCMGDRGLKVTYDPFFKYIFNPELHPDRLNRLLSCILGQNVTVLKVLPTERRRVSEGSSLLIMDILVQLADSSLVNVEMQREGYDFPIERGFCYGSDLLMRQYDVAKKDQGDGFSYRSIKPVYVIVLMDKSPSLFHECPADFIHRSNFSFDTGLELKPLQNFVYISLDIFRTMEHNKLTELDAWMYFLGSDDPADILRILRNYPFFQELYQDIIHFRFQPKELISMYSEALRIMDENTVKFMIDELKSTISQQDATITEQGAALAEKDAALTEKDVALAEKDITISEKDITISEMDVTISEKDVTISEMAAEMKKILAELAKYKNQE